VVSYQYNVVISQAVTYELGHPDYPYSQDAIEDEVRQNVGVYIQNRLVQKNPLGDALHLALASYHKCDYLLRWKINRRFL
jgi:hypothetical protein